MHEKTRTVQKSELDTFAREYLASLPSTQGATVVALSGDLGAGKTTFVKTVAHILGVLEQVTSPTFTIMKGYETGDKRWSRLLHMDAYRIEELSELEPLRFSELLSMPNTIFFIEWAENIQDKLPENTNWLHFGNAADDEVRTVRIGR